MASVARDLQAELLDQASSPQSVARAVMVHLRSTADGGAGWSQSELARRVKPQTTPTQIRKLENGDLNLSPEWIEKLARAFNVRMSAFLPSREIDLHVDAATHEILQLVGDLPHAQRPVLVRAAVEMLSVARHLVAIEKGPALHGDARLAETMAGRWNKLDDAARKRVTEILSLTTGMDAA